jgi:CRISPR-associated endoribonuclease Cas6
MPRRPSSSIDLSQAELAAIQLEVEPIEDAALPSNYTYFLHAWFLDQMRSISPTLSKELHDNQEEKAFTLSGFLGNVDLHDREVLFRSGDRYCWVITGLNASVCQALGEWCDRMPQEIVLPGARFRIVAVEQVLPGMTYDGLWERETVGDLSLTFVSATGFRKAGNHMPLPIPENVFHSYLRRWNVFAPLEFEQDDFLEWVKDYVVIVRHQVRSLKVQAGKQGSVTGFVGVVQFGLVPKADGEPEYVRLVRTLVACAPYFGTGHKVTFGLGQTRSGWLLDEMAKPIVAPVIESMVKPIVKVIAKPVVKTTVVSARQSLIEVRRSELEEIFFGVKKRQGGDRARKAAQMWALILARYEAGESLKAIAADLELPYETVKKYVQLARKVLAEV